MTAPFFSIIIPIYKVEAYLRQCVDSVLTQSFTDFEVILVDDGSPDGCPAICDSYAAADPRIHVIHKPNGGLSDARNAGLRQACGSYIIFLDSDDWWDDNNALSHIREAIEVHKADIVIYGMKKFSIEQNKYYCERGITNDIGIVNVTIRQAIEQTRFNASACDKAIKASTIKDNKLAFVKGQLSEDIEWCIKLLKYSDTVSIIPHNFYIYRQNPNSISHNIKRKNVSDILEVIEKYIVNQPKTDHEQNVNNFLALQYVQLLAVSTLVKTCEIQDLLTRMKSLWFILNNNQHPRVKKVSKMKLLGFAICRKILGLYLKLR